MGRSIAAVCDKLGRTSGRGCVRARSPNSSGEVTTSSRVPQSTRPNAQRSAALALARRISNRSGVGWRPAARSGYRPGSGSPRALKMKGGRGGDVSTPSRLSKLSLCCGGPDRREGEAPRSGAADVRFQVALFSIRWIAARLTPYSFASAPRLWPAVRLARTSACWCSVSAALRPSFLPSDLARARPA